MTFEEWYNDPLIRQLYNRIDAQHGWEACKQEVLKTLLANKTIAYPSYCGTIGRSYVQENVIKEIENL